MPEINISRKEDSLFAFGEFKSVGDVEEAIETLKDQYGFDVHGTIAILEIHQEGSQWRFQIGGSASDVFIYIGANVTEDMPTNLVVDGDKVMGLSDIEIATKFNVPSKIDESPTKKVARKKNG